MGVRYFCDQCGNTISDRKTMNQVQYGPSRSYDEDDEDDEVPTRGKKPVKVQIRRVNIELCDHCLPTWMKRVAALTEKSNV